MKKHPAKLAESTDATGPPESAAAEGEAKPSRSWGRALLFLLIKLATAALLLWLALTFVFGVFRLAGNNMYPALKDGDLCVTYKLGTYHSGDVVAYRVNGELRFGRIIAKAGDTVDGNEEGLIINGLAPSEEVFYPTQILDTDLRLPYTVNTGEYVVLNDYREDFSDSRTYGPVAERELEGKIIFIFRRRGF